MAAALRQSFLRLSSSAGVAFQKRYKHKKKWAVNSGKRAPSDIALAFFDTYYEPLFGAKLWASVREALLSDTKKYCALVNNFALSESTIVDLISEVGATDIWTITGKTLRVPSVAPSIRSSERRHLEAAEKVGNGVAIGSSSAPLTSAANSGGIVDADGSRFASPSSSGDQAISPSPVAEAVPAAEDANQEEEFFTTPEGFLIPRPRKGASSSAANMLAASADLMEFIPAAERAATENEQLLAEESRQYAPPSLLPASSPIAGRPAAFKVHVLHDPADDELRMPHLLRAYVREDVEGATRRHAFRQPKKDASGFLDYYLLDGASLLPVLALDLSPNDAVLDLCAGPGGKTLAIVQTLLFDRLVCVDSSLSRLKRLRESLSWYVPASMLESGKVSTLHMDGRRVGSLHTTTFDKVLVDVPCTTDRQALHEDENSLFAPSRKRERLKLPELQAELLRSALEACRPGGTVVYSTCTLSPGQNDSVIEEAFARVAEAQPQPSRHSPAGRYAVIDTSCIAKRLGHVFKFWKGSAYGQIVLPTAQANFGPMYFCKIKKLSA